MRLGGRQQEGDCGPERKPVRCERDARVEPAALAVGVNEEEGLAAAGGGGQRRSKI